MSNVAGTGGPHGADAPRPGAPSEYGGGAPKANWRQYAKAGLGGLAVLCAAILVFSNTEQVQVDLLFSTREMPLFVALLLAMFLGAIIGASLFWGWRRARAKAKRD